MRTWLVRIKTSYGHEYHEWDLPTEKEAYDFAWEWWESDPEIRRLELTDSAGRADPLILDRYRTLKPTVWARKTEYEPSRSISDALNEGRIDEYGGPSFAADFADLALMYQERGFSQDEAEALAVADLRSRFPRRDSGGRIMSRKRAINNPYSPDTNPYLTEPPGVPDDLLDGPPHEYSFEPPDNEALQRVFEDREARRKRHRTAGVDPRRVTQNSKRAELVEGEGIFGILDTLSEAEALAIDIGVEGAGPSLIFRDTQTGKYVVVSEYDSWKLDDPRYDHEMTIRGGPFRAQAILDDMPMGYVNEFFPPLGLLPDNQQFAEPFTDDTPEEDEVVARKQANWVATTETVNGMTVNVLTLDRGNLLINIIEGPEFLLTTGGRYIWTVTNLYGEEVAGGRENTAAEAQAEALGYIEDEKGLVSLPFAARLRAMTKDILISNPDLGMAQAQKLAAEVISTYPQVFGAHDDFVKKLMDEYDLTRADAETEAQYQYDQDPGTMDQWNVLDKTRQTTSGTTVTTTPRLRFDTSTQWSYTKGSK